MKLTVFVILLTLIFSNQACAQLQNGSVAPNFTLTDIDGNTHELYDYLDQGKAVLLDFFAVWCGSCQAHAPSLENAYQAYGPNGDNSMQFFALESEDNTSDPQCDNYNGYQWSQTLSYPIINTTSSTPNDYAISFYPTIYIVCPDRFVTQVGMVDASTIGNFITANCDLTQYDNDLMVEDIHLNANPCEGTISPAIELKNVGINGVSNPQINVYLDGQLTNSLNWLSIIQPGSNTSILVPTIQNLSPGNHVINVSINPDDNLSNNSIEYNFTQNNFSATDINLSLTFDNYPQETSWQILNDNDEVVYSGSDYNAANSTFNTTLSLEAGCYTFNIFDSYGDGICCTNGNGSYSIGIDAFAFSGADFGHVESVEFLIETPIENSSQELILSSGWSMFSTYIIADTMSFDHFVMPIQDKVVIAKNYLGLAYLPEWNFNGIGDVLNEQGYQIKTTQDCSITIEGITVTPQNTTIHLVEGWNIISYLRTSPASANLVFEPLKLQGNIVIAKDEIGAAYLPEWDYNGIGMLSPGKGYQLKTNYPGQLQYISNNDTY